MVNDNNRYNLEDMHFNYYDDLQLYFVKSKVENANKHISTHWHDSYEIEFLISGTADEIINDCVYKAESGDIFLLTPNDLHELRNINGAVCCNMMFPESFISDELLIQLEERSLFTNVFARLEKRELEKVKTLISIIEDELDSNDTNRKVVVKNIINVILSFLIRYGFKENTSGKKYVSVRRAVKYIKSNFKKQITLNDVANAVGLETKYFSVLFKKSIGVSYKDFLNETRLKYALQCISQSDVSITEICYSCGYGSVSNFNRMFKRKYGMSPNEYRLEKKRNSEDTAIIKNGSFENGRNGWIFSDNYIDNSSASGEGKSIVLVKWCHLRQMINIESYTEYRFSFDIFNIYNGWAIARLITTDNSYIVDEQLVEYGRNGWETVNIIFNSDKFETLTVDFASDSDNIIRIDNIKIEPIEDELK